MTTEVEIAEAPEVEQAPVPAGPTAKEMAAAEEANQLRLKKIAERNAELAKPKPEEQTIVGLAAQGMDVLHDAIRAHSNQPTHPAYIPPPRTGRQMTALQEELEAGRRAQQRAQAQLEASRAARAAAPKDPKEGFTTPVYRPGEVVPDPKVPAVGGFAAGTKVFGPDA